MNILLETLHCNVVRLIFFVLTAYEDGAAPTVIEINVVLEGGSIKTRPT